MSVMEQNVPFPFMKLDANSLMAIDDDSVCGNFDLDIVKAALKSHVEQRRRDDGKEELERADLFLDPKEEKLSIQDVLRREKRKELNRESARKSREKKLQEHNQLLEDMKAHTEKNLQLKANVKSLEQQKEKLQLAVYILDNCYPAAKAGMQAVDEDNSFLVHLPELERTNDFNMKTYVEGLLKKKRNDNSELALGLLQEVLEQKAPDDISESNWNDTDLDEINKIRTFLQNETSHENTNVLCYGSSNEQAVQNSFPTSVDVSSNFTELYDTVPEQAIVQVRENSVISEFDLLSQQGSSYSQVDQFDLLELEGISVTPTQSNVGITMLPSTFVRDVSPLGSDTPLHALHDMGIPRKRLLEVAHPLPTVENGIEKMTP
ncbi:uncharacterized protein LOC101858324 [Aplysia californica]|uniref:Uncharacterized protein LOC101858324 n=1 Tax=Aplysia californica TaxID=6500 RepID=A0ABM0JD94_APLCA|nr:uncharacterized protein LOC101858324 [Aplysia californica]